MNTKQSILTATIVSLLVSGPIQAGWKAQSQGGSDAQIQVVEQLSDAEEANLLFMREEEKLARDVYRTLSKQWSQPVFYNISTSEQRHMDSLAVLLNRYALLDPVIDDSVGVFVNPELAALYTALTTEGAESLIAALIVGAKIEEIDILDLQRAIAESTHPDLIQVYENLMRGSRNHLRAFVRQIEGLGVAYESQMMEQSDVDMILDSPMERGRNSLKGRRGR
ncbi:ferritin [bacterium endosymbiont of Escarpia laminata]|nr:MAG: ferritin [bacterium endosymbiont of Escarpia laminata]RLJ20971.1 MAG: ferritin [bacterium endosymbiont of Escarpia laminata]